MALQEFAADVTVSTEAELAHVMGSEWAHAAPHVFEVLQTTGHTLIQLQNQWAGNEFFGTWTPALFADVDGKTVGGAIHYNQAVNFGYPVSNLKTAHNRRQSEAWGNDSIRRHEQKAFNWLTLLDTRSPENDDEFVRLDDFMPTSVITRTVTAEPTTDNMIVDKSGIREGRIEEADVTVAGVARHQYGKKVVLAGDTYEAFGRDDLNDVVDWDETHLSFNTFDQEMWSHDVEAAGEVFSVLARHGYTVGVQSGPVAKTIAEDMVDVETQAEAIVSAFEEANSDVESDSDVPEAFK